MPPTLLNPTIRYVSEGTRRVYFVPVLADYTAPTRTEIDAGIDLTCEIAEMTGFTVTSNSMEVPDMCTRFTAKIPGRVVADDSAIRFYASLDSDDIRTVLIRDMAGFILTLWEGDVAGALMDVWPVKVISAAMQTVIDDPASCLVSLAVTRVPAQNVTVP